MSVALSASSVRVRPVRASVGAAERRRDPRCPAGSAAVVSAPSGPTTGHECAVVWDVSRRGLGLVTAAPIRPNTLVRVEFETEDVRPRLAQVVHATGESDGWLIGCELRRPFTEAELAVLRDVAAV